MEAAEVRIEGRVGVVGLEGTTSITEGREAPQEERLGLINLASVTTVADMVITFMTAAVQNVSLVLTENQYHMIRQTPTPGTRPPGDSASRR